jgi:hypothetical protein
MPPPVIPLCCYPSRLYGLQRNARRRRFTPWGRRIHAPPIGSLSCVAFCRSFSYRPRGIGFLHGFPGRWCPSLQPSWRLIDGGFLILCGQPRDQGGCRGCCLALGSNGVLSPVKSVFNLCVPSGVCRLVEWALAKVVQGPGLAAAMTSADAVLPPWRRRLLFVVVVICLQ